MAAGSLLALLDDIASLLDDVSTMTKVATQKTAGVLGDDLALNAQQVTGIDPKRELPVVWAVAKGSALNKVIIVPAALLVSALAPWLITPVLMIGGAFLCFEGFEKVVHKLFHRDDADEKAHREKLGEARADPKADLVELEKDKVKGAIRTDFILSAEIIVIALGTLAAATFTQRLLVLVAIAAIVTVGVYGLVAAIVKLDDLGLALSRWDSNVARRLGSGILRSAPVLMRLLGVVGTIAMFLVGGGILSHGIPPIHHLVEEIGHYPGVWGVVSPTLLDLATGILAGAVLVGVITAAKRLRGPIS